MFLFVFFQLRTVFISIEADVDYYSIVTASKSVRIQKALYITITDTQSVDCILIKNKVYSHGDK